MKNPVSLKQIVIDFIYIKEQLIELFKEEKQYHLIIDFLLAKDYLDDDLDLPYPKVKDIEEATGLKTHNLRKMLLEMHEQIFGFANVKSLCFKKVLYHFNVHYYGSSCTFTISKLEHLPRVGENISLPFIKAITNINWFYVEEIKHEFENTTQNVYLTLKVGEYNSYWQFSKDQALALKEIGFTEVLDSSETELKRKVFSKNHWRR
jgi:hypothetical protein